MEGPQNELGGGRASSADAVSFETVVELLERLGRLRRNAQRVDLLRIDHFRGFAASWVVPADEAVWKSLGAPPKVPTVLVFDRAGALETCVLTHSYVATSPIGGRR